MNKTSNKTLLLIIHLALALVITAVFFQLLRCDFVTFDDAHYVSENPYVKTGLTRDNIIWAFTPGKFGYWHPVTWLSHMLDSQIYGMNPGMHHLTNLLIHLANTLLLFLILSRLTGTLWKSAFVAALFALHPLNVDSVAWIAERKNLLSTLFWLLTMWAYTHYARQKAVLPYLLALVLFALGLLTKPMLVTLPFVLLLLDYWPLDRLHLGRQSDGINQDAGQPETHTNPASALLRLLWEKIPFFVLSAASIGLSYWSSARLATTISTELVPIKLRIANALVSYITYISKAVWPHKLAVFYPYPQAVPLAHSITALILLVSVTVLFVWVFRKKRYLTVGWLWYLGTLVPVIGLVQVGLWPAFADRWAYVPLIGIFLIVAWAVPDLLAGWPVRKAALAASAAIILLALALCTHLQLRYWRSSTALFQHAIDVTDDNYQAHFSMIKPLLKEGKFAQAIEHGQKSLELNPYYATAHNSLGAVLLESGRLDEAFIHLKKALQLKPDFPAAHVNLGALFVRQDKLEQAVEHFAEALRLQPDLLSANVNIASVFTRQNKLDQAVEHYKQALRISPDLPDIHNNLGLVLARQQKLIQAARHYTEAIRIEPDFADAHKNLAYVLVQQQNFNQAVHHYNRALKITPDSAAAHNDLGVVLVRQGKLRQALVHFNQALRLNPDANDVRKNINAVLKVIQQSQPNEPNQP
jgi:tetratricopeptide (TPR) repeat protein